MISFHTPPTVNLGPDTGICGGSLILDAGNAGGTFHWTDNSTSQTYNVTSTGLYSVTVTDTNGCTGNDARLVTLNPKPVVNLGPDQSLCTTSAMLDAGNPSATFMWTGGSTGQFLTVTTTGTYAVTVTDTGTHCAAADSVMISFHTPPTVNLGPDTGICGGSLILDAGNAGGTFHWTDNSTSQTYNVTATGLYSVTVTDTNGCTGNDARLVTLNPKPVVNLGPDQSLCTTTTMLDAGNPSATFMWTGGSTGQFLTVTTSGTYAVTVTDTGTHCAAVDSVMISFHTPPTVNLGPDTGICGGSLILDAGNAGGTFHWTDNSTSQTYNVTATGLYSVTVTDTNGCTGNDARLVTLNPKPVVNLGPDQSLCTTSAMLDAGNPSATFMWTGGSTGQFLTVTTTGTYAVTVTDTGTHCAAADSVMISFHTPPTVNLGPDTGICGGSLILDAGNAGGTFHWTDNSTSQTYNVTATGLYSVTVTDTNGCTGNDARLVTLNPKPVVNLGPDQSLCTTSAMLDAGNPSATFMWTAGSTGQFLTVTTTGTYAVTVTDTGTHCAAADSVMISFHTPPTVNLGPDTGICGGSLILDAGNAGGTFHWTDNSTSQTYNVTATGLYSVTVTDTNGCTGNDARLVTVSPQPNLGADITDSICQWSTVDLYTYYQGSGLALTYNTSTPGMAAPGVYTVIGTSGAGCFDTAIITITTRQSPSLGPDLVDSVCIGASADLNTLIPNSGYTTYTWNTANTHNAGPGTYQLIVSSGNGCTDTAVVYVYNRIAQPIVDLGPDTVQCGGTVTMDVEIGGGTYLWSDSSTSFLYTATATGIYSVTVTNSNGCTASDSRLIVINPKPDLGPDITDSICPGSRANLYNYYINSGLTLTYGVLPPSSVDTGHYTIIGTNSNGCKDTAIVTIVYRQKPFAGGAKTDSICPGYKYDLTTLYPNTGFSSYSWNTSNATAVDTGTYQLVVSNASGCFDTAIATITLRVKPNLGGNKTDSICIGYAYDLRQLYPDNGTYVSYVWNVGNDSAVSVGTYRLVVTNASGCMDTAYATIVYKMLPVVTLPAYPNVCITIPAFQLTGGLPIGGTYYIDNTVDSTFRPAVLGAGTHYVVYVFTNKQGCTDSAIRYITVFPQPVIYDTIALPNLCNGSPLLDLNNYFTPNGGVFSGIGVSGNYFYPTLAAIGSDSITYIYTDVNGCMDTAGRRISIIPSVAVSLHTVQSDFTICRGQTISFTGTGAQYYQFFVNDSAVTGRDTTSTFSTATLNNHDQVTVVGSNYCSSDTSEFMIIDVIPLPSVVAGPDTTIDLGQTVQLYANSTGSSALVYLWTPDSSLNMVNIPNPVYSGSDTITFQVKVTDAHGCTATDNVTINVRIPDDVQLPNVITPNGDGKNDMWILNPKIDLIGSHLVIFNRWGETVFETDNYANDWAGIYKSSGHKVPDGTYYYTLSVPAQHNHQYKGSINILSSGN